MTEARQEAIWGEQIEGRARGEPQDATQPAQLRKRQHGQKARKIKSDAPTTGLARTHATSATEHEEQGEGPPATRLHLFFCCLQRSH
jgi:hypothetical protein